MISQEKLLLRPPEVCFSFFLLFVAQLAPNMDILFHRFGLIYILCYIKSYFATHGQNITCNADCVTEVYGQFTAIKCPWPINTVW